MRTASHRIAAARVLAGAALAACALLAGPAVPAVAAPDPSVSATPAPTGTVTWTVQPATADGPDGRISLRHVLDPGASVEEHVAVTNFSDRDATFVLYAGDGVVGDTGDFDVPFGPDSRQDAGAWVELGEVEGAQRLDDGRLQLTLGPSSTVLVPLTISVPADAAPGDHPAGVVAELVDGGSEVRLAARVGTRLHLRVSGDIQASVVADEVDARWEPSWNPFGPGAVRVRYVVRNAGDVRLGARSTVQLAGPGDTGSAEAVSEVREVLPDRSALVEVTLPVWPLLRASGGVEVTPLVVGEDVVEVKLERTTAAVAVWTPPWSQLALVLLVVAGVLLVRWLRRRSARRVQAHVAAALAAAGVDPARAAGPSGAGPREPDRAGRSVGTRADEATP
ncbi:COG1470 family protein [Cellulomonas persica]|uniref:DUF916 domain-containing protein n=1 Tax=Cellulomonas persica TaxID=76861 RepID=A0A510UUF2_9CELL|nr:hypothetical protein [Cellulomonas persica]GEK16810.1 hypothetical protein CPE01_05430 [Cellulomonas persica]